MSPSILPSPSGHNRAAHIASLLAAAATVCALTTLAVFGLKRPSLTPVLASSLPLDPPSSSQMTRALVAAGLDPQALSAACVSGADTAGVVGAARDHLEVNGRVLFEALAAHRSAVASVRSLERLVVSGQATSQQIIDLATTRSALERTASTRQSQLSALITAATAGLSQPQRDALASIAANRRREVPLQYTVVHRTDEQWVHLREARANVRIASDMGREPDSGSGSVIVAADADQSVAASAAAIVRNSAGLTAAWNTAVHSPE